MEGKTVLQKFLDICITKGVDASKPKDIFAAIQNTLKKYDVPWDNCIAFGVDNITAILEQEIQSSHEC